MKKATARVEKHPIRTYTWDKPSRYPILFGGGYRFIYPYTMEDRLLHHVREKEYTEVILENEYIKLIVLPELGGHLWAAEDKVAGKQIFYNNQVVKPGLIALRGAWCATGVEWNFPIGHSVSTVSTVDYTFTENPDGSATAVIGDLDRTTRMKWTVKLTVRPGELAFSVETVLSNPTGYPHRYMYWENAGIHGTEGFQFIAPSKFAWTWGGKRPFPVIDGVDKSWYTAHPRSIDYFMLGLGQDYFGYFDHKRRFGAVHIADYHLMPGKKFFTWGMAQHAQSWKRNLTDDDGPYIELQCGLTPTQASFDFFPPQSARRWDEMWFSIGDLGYFVHANRQAALHLSDRFEKPPYPGEVEAAVVTNRAFPKSTVRVTSGGKAVYTKEGVDFAPGVPVRWKVIVPRNAKELTVNVTSGGVTAGGVAAGEETVIEYSTLDWKKIRELPYENPGQLWSVEKGSPEKLVKAGVSWLKWFEYAKALKLIDKAIAARPGYSEAHYWKGNILFDLCKFDAAARELAKVSPRDDNFATAQFLTGEMHRYAGRRSKAGEIAALLTRRKDGERLGVELAAEVAASKRDFAEAARLFAKLSAAKTAAPHTIALYAAMLRRHGQATKAAEAALGAVEIDPLDYLGLNELALVGQPTTRDIVMRGAVESYIELSSYYEDLGLFEEAAGVLEHYRADICEGDCNPLVYYHLGWANDMLGRTSEAAAFYALGSKGNPDNVFPYRREDMLALEAALSANSGDSLAHYLLGTFLAWRQHTDDVMPHWQKALKGLGAYPVLLRNVAQYHKSHKELAKAYSFYKRAVAAAPADEELRVEMDDTVAKMGKSKERVKLLEAGLAARRDSQKLRKLLAQACYFAGDYDKSLHVLMGKEFDSWEGEHMVHHVYVLCHMAKGQIFLAKKKWQEALESFQKAMEYPTNFKIGKPAFPRHAPQLYLSAIAYEGMGETEKALAALKQGGEESHEGWEGTATEEGYYKGLCLARLGRTREARAIWRHMTKGVEHYGLEASYNHFLKGLGYQGLGDWKNATKYLELALSADRTNSKTRYHIEQARKHKQAGL